MAIVWFNIILRNCDSVAPKITQKITPKVTELHQTVYVRVTGGWRQNASHCIWNYSSHREIVDKWWRKWYGIAKSITFFFSPEEELESLLLLEFALLESLESLLSLLDELDECRLRLFDFFFFDFFELLSLRISATPTLPLAEPSPRFWSFIFKLSAEKERFVIICWGKMKETRRQSIPGKVKSFNSINLDDALLLLHKKFNELCASSWCGMIARQSWYAFFASSIRLSSSKLRPKATNVSPMYFRAFAWLELIFNAVSKSSTAFLKEPLFAYSAPRATRPSTLRGSMVSALFKHWNASECRPSLKCSIPSATDLWPMFRKCVRIIICQHWFQWFLPKCPTASLRLTQIACVLFVWILSA